MGRGYFNKVSNIGKIIKFLVENIIRRFGVPQQLIMDNGPNFKGKDMKSLL